MDEKVLVVDDQEGIRNVLNILLSDIGYQVFLAANTEEGLQILRDVNPPIVLTDIKMPGRDGIEFLREIKQVSPETEVIMITGHGDMDLAIKSLKYEATDFINKPIRNDVLEIALKRAREKISMRQELRAYTENLEVLVREKSAKLVEAERQIAAQQVVEGLSSVMRDISDDLQDGIRYFNEMPCFVSIHNRDFKIVATNQIFKERLGDKIGANSWEIYKNGTGREKTCPVWKTFQTGEGLRTEETVTCLNGKEQPVVVHTAPIRGSEQEVELVLEIAADITEVKRLQEELRETQQRYQQLFNEAPCYISVQDKEHRITATNLRFKEDFGDNIGGYCYEVYKHRTDPCPDCVVLKTFEDGKSYQDETIVTSKNGEPCNVLIWTAPIRNAIGEITQVMEMSTNITQIRELQDHLTSLGLLIGSVSHGVKGILTGLDGGMYRIESGLENDDKQRIKDGWEVVKLMVGRIRNMVLDILYYAKKRELKWERVDVLSFAHEVAATVESKTLTHKIDFIRNFDKSAGDFEVDASVVSSALVNILENAIDACLNDHSKKKHKIVFDVKEEKDCIRFEVSDNGIGMDQNTLENIFTLFFSSKGNKGTGLGLFISNQIIQQHGGSIKVESTPSHGSHFNIRMPKTLPETVKNAQDGK
jgi:PAS domain S-box-containing protein